MNALLFDWPFVGLALAVALLVYLAVEPRPGAVLSRWRDPSSLLPLLWPMYLVHQFEEHGIDLFGHRFAFLQSLCSFLGYAHGGCPGDPAFIFAVNVVCCQAVFAMTFVFRRSRPLIAVCAWGTAVVNAVTHIGGSVSAGAYEPGLATSIALFVPVSFYVIRECLHAGVITRRQLLRMVATGGALHVTLIGSMMLRAHGVISHTALLVINAMNGVWPLVFGTVGVRNDRE